MPLAPGLCSVRADGGDSTFMGIGIRNLSAADAVESEAYDLAAAVRQVAAGLLGTSVQLADLVRRARCSCASPKGLK